jgi:DivIVA protein
MSIPDGSQRPPFRYRRFGGGYRREDVDFALAEMRLTLRQLDNDLTSLHDRNRELEGELARTRSEIEAFRAKEQELWQTMSIALRRAEEIEKGATARAREIVAQAEEAAARIRSEASSRIEDTRAQFNELLRLKDSLLEEMRRVVGDFDHAISDVGRREQLFPGVMQDAAGEVRPQPVQEAASLVEPEIPPAESASAEPTPAPRFVPRVEQAPPPVEPLVSGAVASESVAAAPPAPEPDSISIPAAPPPPVTPLPVSPPPVSPPPPAAYEEPVFEKRLELDAGPFSDFAALSAFERALGHLPEVEEVYVRRLADDRALIELTLNKVAPLLQTMRESLPYALDVRSASRSKIVLNVSVQTPAGTR